MSEPPSAEPGDAPLADPGAEYLASLDAQSLEAIVEAMVLVAWADGVVSDSERERLVANVATLTAGRLSAGELATKLDDITARVADADRKERLGAIASRLVEPTARRVAVVLASDVAAADGVLREEERALCLLLATALGLRADEIDALGLSTKQRLTQDGAQRP